MFVKAIIINTDEKLNTLNAVIPVMFNPPELDITKTTRYEMTENPKQDVRDLVFLQGDNEELSIDLFFDTTDLGVDVRLITDKIVELTKVKKIGVNMEGKDIIEPPHLIFVWGPMCFNCRMTSVKQTYEHFDAFGQPLRAVLKVTLVGYDRIKELRKQIPIGQIATLTSYMGKDGDRIDVIAAKKKGSSQNWKAIASENKIKNPLTIPSGTRLKISE